MRFASKVVLVVSFLVSNSLSRQITGSGEAAFFDSTAFSDAIRITMKSVSPPAQGKVYIAWLVADSDTQYTKLGQLTVQGNGDVVMAYKVGSNNNLIAANKKFIITQETSPFSGNKPSLSAVVFADSLNGPGTPPAGSPLVRIRNCVVTFSNTAQNYGLAMWMKQDTSNFIQHAGFARDGAVANDTSGANTHSDHIYDFIQGKLINGGHGSIAANGDPVGHGYRRYGDLGTKDSSQGGAGSLGGAGYHVKQAIADSRATLQMKKSGSSALAALTNDFGANNDSGWAKQLTDEALKIIIGAYAPGNLPIEGSTLYSLARRFIYGTAGVTDTASATGGVRQAYYHMQRMAAFVLTPPASKLGLSKSSVNFGTILVGLSKTDSLYIRNTGSNQLTIDSVQMSGPPFSIQPSSASVAINDSAKFRVTFAPSAQGLQTGKAFFFSNAPSRTDTVALQGSGTLTSVEPNTQMPRQFSLHQNYPNPFNSSTEITFDIPSRSRVWIVIHNILGQEVARLADGEDLPPGTYRTRWYGTAASGMYFCRFRASSVEEARSFSEVLRMILLR